MFLSPSHLFILYSFWASFFVVIASPVTVNTTQLERRTETETAPVNLWISDRGGDEEHWALGIGTVHAFDAFLPKGNNRLTAREFTYDKSKEAKLLSLDCTATFKSEEDKQKIFKGLVDIKMEKPAKEIGGNCMDYVKSALTYLKKKGSIPKIPEKFDELWNSDYDTVRAVVWGP